MSIRTGCERWVGVCRDNERGSGSFTSLPPALDSLPYGIVCFPSCRKFGVHVRLAIVFCVISWTFCEAAYVGVCGDPTIQ